jgi:hypothetical protein
MSVGKAKTASRVQAPSRLWPITDEQACAALAEHYCGFQRYIQNRERWLLVAGADAIVGLVRDCETMGPSDFRAKYGRNKPSWGHLHEWLKAEKGRKEVQGG